MENSIEKDEKILNNIKTYMQENIDKGWHKFVYNDLGCHEKCIDIINAIEHILSDYKKVLKENEEKNKIIDSMIKEMIDSSICDYFIKENCKNYAGKNRKICDDCIKEYFENKVKEVK